MKEKKERSAAYAKSGVNLDVAEIFGAYCGKICQESYKNSPFVRVTDLSNGHFRSPRMFQFKGLPKGYGMMTAPDGIGTKTIIISSADCLKTAGDNLVAMTKGDITRWGGLGLVFVNVLEVNKLGEVRGDLFRRYQSMMAGLGDTARSQKFVLISGETAQMSDCVSSEIAGIAADHLPIFNWSGVMIGVISPDKVIDGSTAKPGDVAIVFRDGMRSNGASLARKFLRKIYGPEWWRNPAAAETVRAMANPSALYDTFLETMNGWYRSDFRPIVKVCGIAHLTGGSFKSKLGDGLAFPAGLNIRLDNLFEPPQWMKDCVREFGLSDEEAYTVFSGGQGLVVLVNKRDEVQFCNAAGNFGLEARRGGVVDSWALGKDARSAITIVSQFTGKEFAIRQD